MASLLADDAHIALALGEHARALEQSRRATGLLVRRKLGGLANYREDAALGEIKRSGRVFLNLGSPSTRFPLRDPRHDRSRLERRRE